MEIGPRSAHHDVTPDRVCENKRRCLARSCAGPRAPAGGTILLATTLLLAALAARAVPANVPSALGAHAPAWARAQGRGAVVTAERDHGPWRYALGGEPFAAGHAAVAPERIEFEIGSISKVFTGLLLAHAVHEGKLALTDTLAARLPVKFASQDLGGITLKQLATHTSCLPRLPDNLGTDATDPYAKYDEEALFAYLAHARLAQAPPCAADYSNLGFGVLGVVLQRAYGRPWDALVHDEITAPLGMSDTAQHLSAEQQARLAQPWAGGERAQPWTFQAVAGAGALRSTAADLAKLADALGAGAGGPLRDVWPILTGDEVEAPGLGGRIGLALLHDRAGGQDRYWHDGGTGGFRSTVRVFPRDGRALIVLASNADAPIDAWLAAWSNAGRLPAERREIALTPSALDEYVGVYTLSPQVRYTVLRVGDGLRVRVVGQPFVPVFASARDEFFYRAVEAQISVRREGGKVTGLTLHQNGHDFAAARRSEPPPHIEFPPPESLREFVGEYDFGRYLPGATLTVGALGDGLGAQLTGQPMAPVFATAKDRFEYDVVAATLSFERDAGGRIVAVVLHQNGAEMRAPRK
jgi:D-alanyl-D-alanine-carboxypeptidase/D-alanyl-D-alanine-endopeptidase